MKSRRATAIVLAVSLAAVALAGCKSSSTTSATGGKTTGSTSTTKAAGGSTAAASINVCSLLSAAQVTKLDGQYTYSAATPSTLAPGQDQCKYTNTGGFIDMFVIVYLPSSGASYQEITSISSAATSVPGVGDKAVSGDTELDVQTGDKVIAIKDAGGIGYDNNSFAGAIAIAKALVTALGSTG